MTVHEDKEPRVVRKDENVKDSKDGLGIEVYAVLTLLAVALTSEASKLLTLEKICIFHRGSPHFCNNIRVQNSWNDFRDLYVYNMYNANFVWWTAVQVAFSCVVLAFLGGWSDRTGRRLVILALPVVGVFLQILNGLLGTIFFSEIPFQLFMFVDAACGSIVGCGTVFFGFFIYLVDVTTPEDRPSRFTTVLLGALFGAALGSMLSRTLVKYLGYYTAYLVAFGMNMLNRRHLKKELADPIRTNEQITYDEQGFKEFLKTFFVWSTIKETARAVVKKEPNKRNVPMYIYLGTLFTLFISVFGERQIFELIARYEYSWDSATMNLFNFNYIIMIIFGIRIATEVIKKRLDYHDAVVGVTSCISKIISSFLFAFALPSDILYLGPTINAFNGTGLLAVLFMLMKLLEQNEMGKIAALVGLVENMARLLYVIIYYFMCINMFSGGIFLIGAGFSIPALVVFIWILRKEKREEEAAETTIEGGEDNV